MKKTKSNKINIKFPYGGKDILKNKKYISDRNKLFRENGNGWWFSNPTSKMPRRR